MKNILEFLESAAGRFPDKTAFAQDGRALAYGELLDGAQRVGSALAKLNCKNQPVCVYMDKGVNTILSMMGVVYSGNFYVVLDGEMPAERINKIFSTLQPRAVIAGEGFEEKAQLLDFDGEVFNLGKLLETEIDSDKLAEIRAAQIDTDPLYALYTSGSTGVPKGAILSHRNVIAYSEWVCGEFDFSEETVFANQTPFYFSMSVTDVYSTLRCGATLHIIPKIYFSFPIKLIEFLNNNKVNTIYWVPSAISIVSNFKLFDYAKPQYLKKVLFAGEVMRTKPLNYWINNLDKDVLFANLFGPTETTDICTFYKVNRPFTDDEPLPIGTHCNNCDVMIVAEDGTLAENGEEGELYVRGSFLAGGYYNNPEKTAQAFVQNPLNSAYPETVYKTGDLVKLNELGEILYITRRDFQIKHMGYRIELGEIEAAAGVIEGINEVACVFDAPNDKIVFIYSGKKLDEGDIMKSLRERLPEYLMPNRIIRMKNMPHNQNGKIDRKLLMQNL